MNNERKHRILTKLAKRSGKGKTYVKLREGSQPPMTLANPKAEAQRARAAAISGGKGGYSDVARGQSMRLNKTPAEGM